MREMEFYDKEYGLEVWGDFACFTRPEMKVERVSYDVITPSAARNIFQAIFWKPAIEWQITKIEVINPIKWFSIKRNEVGAVGRGKPDAQPIVVTEKKKRQQRNSLILRDVRYRIFAKMIYLPPKKRVGENRHAAGLDENPAKYQAMFERRASKGQCFNMPYLGTREFGAYFKFLDDNLNLTPCPIQESKDLGIMLYDMDFSNPDDIVPMFFRANMQNGVILIPSPDSNDILR